MIRNIITGTIIATILFVSLKRDRKKSTEIMRLEKEIKDLEMTLSAFRKLENN